MKYLFIDESGDHNLDPKKIDKTFPLFVLTGISISKQDYEKFIKLWKNVKVKIFSSKDIYFHSLELVRPLKSKQPIIQILSNPMVRSSFYNEINQILSHINFTIVAFAIKKIEFSKIFPEHAPDPYFLSFSYIIGEFVKLLTNREKGIIEAEKRNNTLDKQFMLSWDLAAQSRVGLVSSKELQIHQISKPNLYNKSPNHPGLELADMISYRLSRAIMNKIPKKPGNEIEISLINRNLRLGTLPKL